MLVRIESADLLYYAWSSSSLFAFRSENILCSKWAKGNMCRIETYIIRGMPGFYDDGKKYIAQ